MRMDDLEGDLASEPLVTGAINGGHAAVADLLEDLVLGELREPASYDCCRVLHRTDCTPQPQLGLPTRSCSAEKLLVVRVKCALGRPCRRSGQQDPHPFRVAGIDGDDGLRITHGP